MDDPADVDPIPGPEAFEQRDREAQLSQAAFLLASGAAVGGEADQVPRATPLELPPLGALLSPRKLSLSRAMKRVDLGMTEHVQQPDLRIPSAACAHLAREVVDHPTPDAAAALVEASLHSPHPLVRTAAAVAALDTTGPRPDLIERLAEGARSRDELTRALGRTGLGRAAPDHDALRHLVGRPAPLTGRDRKSNTAVVTHGTFASRTTWWQPGGRFPTFLDSLDLHVHDQSFRWSGLYLDVARQRAADEMVDLDGRPGTGHPGPVRAQPRRDGRQPGHPARAGTGPPGPAELAGPWRVEPGLAAGAAGHRHPRAVRPGDHR
jgi:hypothetical protein